MQRISILTITGTGVISLGVALLSLRYYLDILDQEIGKARELAHPCNSPLMCPISPQPYWGYVQPLLYIGIAFCCIGVVIISAKILNGRMGTLQKH